MSTQTLCDICHEPILVGGIVTAALNLRTAKIARTGGNDFHPECLQKVLPNLRIFAP